MQFLVKYSPELTVKSRPVRLRICQRLVRNLRSLLRPLDDQVWVKAHWDHLSIRIQPSNTAECIQRLRHCPGIAYSMEVAEYPLDNLETVYSQIADYYLPQLANKSFAVRCRRTGQHEFKSGDVERTIGGFLLRDADNARVQLKNPDVTVRLDIRGQSVLATREYIPGCGGFPSGSLEPVLSLISGGFDSSVASYLAMRRGLEVHFLFFSLGGKEHRLAVQEVALYLWMNYASTQEGVRFVTVPFEPVVDEIQRSIEVGYTGVVLKRLMLRCAQIVSDRLGAKALVTGEAVAQVSSQTLPNLTVIDQVSEQLIFRPLAFMDKKAIIDIAREIGTEEFSRHIPEYCGAVSPKPKTRARLERVEAEERNLDSRVLEAALDAMTVNSMPELAEHSAAEASEPAIVEQLPPGGVLLDIRHPSERERAPVAHNGANILHIPFYELASRRGELDPAHHYYLYCDQGLMSRLHASHLCDAGHTNVAVYRPSS